VVPELNDESTEPRQRWRIVFERAADAPEPLAPGAAAVETFVARLEAAGIIVARSGNRPRLTLAAPLPIGMSGDRELAGRLADRAIDVGPLENSRALEGMTAVILNVNKHYKAHAGIRLTGLP